MAEIDSRDYADYVFRDGQLVGEFEQMYRKSEQVPWHQDRDGARLDCQTTLDILASRAPYRNVVEVGCGLGYFADLIAQKLGTKSITGVDVSPTAIAKAATLFPELTFQVLDITKPLAGQGQFELVVIRGCFWYLFPHLEQVVANLAALTANGGHILVSQNFPPLDRPFIGNKVIPNPDSLLGRFSPAFEILVDNRLNDYQTNGANDNWLTFLGRKRAV